MKKIFVGSLLLVLSFFTACTKNLPSPTPVAPTAAVTAPTLAATPGEQLTCAISDTTFQVDAEDLKKMLDQSGLIVSSFSISGTGEANTCTPAYSKAIHFMQVTLTAPDEEKVTLGKQLNTLVNVVNDWFTLTPTWTKSHLDKYNIFITVTINPGNHQLSKTPADLLVLVDKGITLDVFWDEANK